MTPQFTDIAGTRLWLRNNTDLYGDVHLKVSHVYALLNTVEEYKDKIQFLLDNFGLCPEGVFTFPDGDTWDCGNK
jgi:hypothetical protein